MDTHSTAHTAINTVDTFTTNPSPQPLRRTRRNRADAVQSFYMTSYGTLRYAVFDAEPSLYAQDGETILSLLAADLPAYTGRLTERAFLCWSLAFVTRQARRYANTLRIMERNLPFIKAAIERTMPHGIFDSALDAADLAQDVAIRVFKNAESLADVDNPLHTAKQSTRVFALARRHLELYVTMPMRDRFNLIKDRIAQGLPAYGDIDTMSEAEYRAQRLPDAA